MLCARCLFAALALVWAGCDKPAPRGAGDPKPAADAGPPVKYTARELLEAVKLGKEVDGKKVEVTGVLRSAEGERAQLPKVTFDAGDAVSDRIHCYLDGPAQEKLERSDTITVTATVKGKVDGVLTLTDAKLVSVQHKKK
jgi:hypothetical protein